jgi:hypothetical protein
MLPIKVLFQVLDMLTSSHKPNMIPQTTFAPSSISVNQEEQELYTAVLSKPQNCANITRFSI